MIDISSWMNEFMQALREVFGTRVWFVGLQGSYGRGEATETSDIDVAVILDELFAEDIAAYDAMLNALPHREFVCGFLSGKSELFCWEPSDLFQFYYDTTPLMGSLDELLPLIDDAAVQRAIKIGVCNVYHACLHNMLHEKSEDVLRGLYKSASFILQAISFRQTGKYDRTQSKLLPALGPEEQGIARTFCALKKGAAVDFEKMSRDLFVWSQAWIEKTESSFR